MYFKPEKRQNVLNVCLAVFAFFIFNNIPAIAAECGPDNPLACRPMPIAQAKSLPMAAAASGYCVSSGGNRL